MDDHELDEVLRSAGRSQPGGADPWPVLEGMRPGLRRARLVRRMQVAGSLGVVLLVVGLAVAALRDTRTDPAQEVTTSSDRTVVDVPSPTDVVPTAATPTPESVESSPTDPLAESEATPTAATAPRATPDEARPPITDPSATPVTAPTSTAVVPTVTPASTATPTPIPTPTPDVSTEVIETLGHRIVVTYTEDEILLPLQVEPAPGSEYEIEKEEPREVKVLFTGPATVEIEIHLEDGEIRWEADDE